MKDAINNGEVIVVRKSKGDILLDGCDAHLATNIHIKPTTRNKQYLRAFRETTINGVRKRVNLARLIMAPSDDMVVDHINHNPLDNRRCNLRICTRAENSRNNSGHKHRIHAFKGVVLHKPHVGISNAWRAYTRVSGKRIWFGYFETEVNAAMAYNRNAMKMFGEFACYNRFDECPVVNLMTTNAIDYAPIRVLSAS